MNNSTSIRFVHRTTCNLCGSDKLISLVRWEYTDPAVATFMEDRWEGIFDPQLFKDVHYEVVECARCHYIFQKNVLDESHLYSNTAECTEERSDRDIANIGSTIQYPYFKAREIERMAFFLQKNPKDITVLDFGSGLGFWSSMAKTYGFNVYALDISNRKNILPEKNITFVRSVEEIQDVEFDFVHTDQVFEHIIDPSFELSRIVPRMKRGAVMYLSVPDCRGIQTILRNSPKGTFLKDASPLAHINCFTHDTLVQLGKKYHLNILSPYTMAMRIFQTLPFSQASFMLQESFKYLYLQSRSTNVYFVKG